MHEPPKIFTLKINVSSTAASEVTCDNMVYIRVLHGKQARCQSRSLLHSSQSAAACLCPAIHTRRARQAGPAPEWEPSAEQLNRAPLLSRDPILFYDEVPLYESELDDNGVSQLSVKVPGCHPALLGDMNGSTCK